MPRTIKYSFHFEDGGSWDYELQFDERNILIPDKEREVKPWTRLSFCRCAHCPLDPDECQQCPIARNIDRIVEDSKETLSVKIATVKVLTPEREYVKKCAAQHGLLALFGLVMASSGCPHLDWLRPLARFHLPFASIEETLFRVLCLQLLTDFFARESQGPESVNLLAKKYEAVEKVNHTFIKRIRNYCSGDADKNAIAALDVFVQLFGFQKENDFSSLRRYFTPLD